MSGVKNGSKSRSQMGSLNISNKVYPLYLGLNIIGRNKTATVTLKNENVSHQQAIITIIDESKHYLSDTHSSNGTYLNETKLTPLVLYELSDQALILFANVKASYSKVLNDTQSIQHSQSSSTQQFSESFYAAQTQHITTESVDKTNKDNDYFDDDVDFSNVPTPPNQELASSAISINEMPTQIFDFFSNEKVSINDLPTQPMYPIVEHEVQIHVSECATVSLVKDSDTDSKDNKCEDITKDNHSNTLLTTSVVDTSLDMIDSTVLDGVEIDTTIPSSCRPIEDEPSPIESDVSSQLQTNKLNNRKLKPIADDSDNSDSEGIIRRRPKCKKLNTQSSEDQELVSQCKYNVEKLQPGTSGIKNNSNSKDAGKNIIESDSETDMEDNYNIIDTSKKTEDKDLSGSETDMDEFLENISKPNKSNDSKNSCTSVVEIPNINSPNSSMEQLSDDDDDFCLLQATNVNEEEDRSDFDTSNFSEKMKKLRENSIVPPETLSEGSIRLFLSDTENSHTNVNTKSKTDMITDKSNDDVDTTPDISDAEQEDNEKTTNNSLQQPKAVQESNLAEMKNETHNETSDHQANIADACSKVVENELEDNVDFFAPTQLIENEISQDKETEIFAKPSDKQGEKSLNSMDDTLSIQETQILSENEINPKPKCITVPDEDIFRRPAQELVNKKDNLLYQNKNCVDNENQHIFAQSTQLLNENEINPQSTAIDDIFLQPTQKLIEPDEDQDKKQKLDKDVFMEPTQNHEGLANRATPSTEFKSNNDIFIQSTQLLNENEINPQLTTKDDIFLQPTQKLIESEESENANQSLTKDIFMEPTQKLLTQNNEGFSNRSTASTELKSNNDIFIESTQLLNENEINPQLTTKDDIFLQPTQKLIESEESENANQRLKEDIFMEPTQKLLTQNNEGLNNQSTASTEFKNSNDIFIQSTQLLNENEVNPQLTTKDDIFLQPTQKLIESEKSGNVTPKEDIFMEQTQKLLTQNDEGLNNQPTSSTELKSDDDTFMQPTQIVDTTEIVPEKSFEPKPKHADVESQLEVMFASQTLRLNTQVSSRPSNPLANMFQEVNTEEEYVKGDSSVLSGNEDANYSEMPTLPIDELTDNNVQVTLKSVKEKPRKRGRPKDSGNCLQVSERSKRQKQNKDNVDSVKEPDTSNSTGTGKLEMNKNSDNTGRKQGNTRKRVLKNNTNVDSDAPTTSKRLRNTIFENENSDNAQESSKKQEVATKNQNNKEKDIYIEEAGCSTSTENRNTNFKVGEEILVESLLKKNKSSVSSKDAKTKKQIKKKDDIINSNGNRRQTRRNKDTSHDIIMDDNEETEIICTEDSETTSIKSTRSRSRNQVKSIENAKDVKDNKTKTRKSNKAVTVDDNKKENSDETNAAENTEASTSKAKNKKGRKPKQTKISKSEDKSTKEDNEIEEKVGTDSKKRETMTSIDNKETVTSNTVDTESITLPKSKQTRKTKQKEIAIEETETLLKKPTRKNKTSTKLEDSSTSKVSKASVSTSIIAESPKPRRTKKTEESFVTSTPIQTQSANQKRRGTLPGTEEDDDDDFVVPTLKGKQSLKESISVKKSLTRRSTKDSTSNNEEPSTSKTLNSTLLLGTPEKSRRQQKPKVVFTMLDSPELESAIRSLGGSIVDTVNACTVLVTGNLKRTAKLLTAVGQGKPICSPEWIKECKKARKFVDPWDYILKDEEAETKWDLSLRESIKKSLTEKIFDGITVCLVVNNAVDVLRAAVEACGGKCVSKPPPKSAGSNYIVVASPENKAKYLKFLKQKPPITVVTPEAIFDGVLRQELRFDEHSLTV